MKKVTFTLRIPESDILLWKQCAKARGLPLSEWMRRACNWLIPHVPAQASMPGQITYIEDFEQLPIKRVKESKPKDAPVLPVSLADVNRSIGSHLCPHGKETGRFCFDCRGIV